LLAALTRLTGLPCLGLTGPCLSFGTRLARGLASLTGLTRLAGLPGLT
jgi:hypothetical protein